MLNITAISRRKLDMPIDEVIAAINSLDLKKLSLENVELLQKMVPTDVETKAYKDFIVERKDQNQLTDEDKFMLQLATRVDRTSSKLSIMNFMGNFFDSMHLICPVSYICNSNVVAMFNFNCYVFLVFCSKFTL